MFGKAPKISKTDLRQPRTSTEFDEMRSKINSVWSEEFDTQIYLDDTSNLSPQYMRTLLRQIERETGEMPKFVGVDYFQLMRLSPVLMKERRITGRAEELAWIANDLLALVKEFDLVMTVAAQLNRTVNKFGEPYDNSIYMSDVIYHTSHNVMFLWDNHDEEDLSIRPAVREVLGKVDKAREGRPGKFKLMFDYDHMRINDVAQV